MKVLVSGNRGYIGSVLVKKLLDKNYKVVGFDSGFFEKCLIKSKKDPRYKTIKKDIRKISSKDLVGVDAIIHLSALSNDPMGEIDKKLTEDINFKASVRLAKLAKKTGVKRFIFSSSCSVYGIAKNGIVSEKSKVNPLTAYAISKVKTEKELKKLASKDFFVGLLRNSTVYGFSPCFRNDLVVNNLVTTALAFSQIRIMSDGTPWRPLIDVRDLSDIFIEFLETTNKEINGKVLNIGFKENNFQVKDLIDVIKKQLPKCEVIYTGEHGSDSRSYKVQFDLFKKYFPNVKQKWELSKSVSDLIKQLRSINYGKKDFNSKKYMRLAIIGELIKKNKIDSKLFWTRHDN
jgi:nucleoside-diphosphate-sugar epimerase